MMRFETGEGLSPFRIDAQAIASDRLKSCKRDLLVGASLVSDNHAMGRLVTSFYGTGCSCALAPDLLARRVAHDCSNRP